MNIQSQFYNTTCLINFLDTPFGFRQVIEIDGHLSYGNYPNQSNNSKNDSQVIVGIDQDQAFPTHALALIAQNGRFAFIRIGRNSHII